MNKTMSKIEAEQHFDRCMKLVEKVSDVLKEQNPSFHEVFSTMVLLSAYLFDTRLSTRDLETVRDYLNKQNSSILSILSAKGWE